MDPNHWNFNQTYGRLGSGAAGLGTGSRLDLPILDSGSLGPAGLGSLSQPMSGHSSLSPGRLASLPGVNYGLPAAMSSYLDPVSLSGASPYKSLPISQTPYGLDSRVPAELVRYTSPNSISSNKIYGDPRLDKELFSSPLSTSVYPGTVLSSEPSKSWGLHSAPVRGSPSPISDIFNTGLAPLEPPPAHSGVPANTSRPSTIQRNPYQGREPEPSHIAAGATSSQSTDRLGYTISSDYRDAKQEDLSKGLTYQDAVVRSTYGENVSRASNERYQDPPSSITSQVYQVSPRTVSTHSYQEPAPTHQYTDARSYTDPAKTTASRSYQTTPAGTLYQGPGHTAYHEPSSSQDTFQGSSLNSHIPGYTDIPHSSAPAYQESEQNLYVEPSRSVSQLRSETTPTVSSHHVSSYPSSPQTAAKQHVSSVPAGRTSMFSSYNSPKPQAYHSTPKAKFSSSGNMEGLYEAVSPAAPPASEPTATDGQYNTLQAMLSGQQGSPLQPPGHTSHQRAPIMSHQSATHQMTSHQLHASLPAQQPSLHGSHQSAQLSPQQVSAQQPSLVPQSPLSGPHSHVPMASPPSFPSASLPQPPPIQAIADSTTKPRKRARKKKKVPTATLR